MSTANTLLMNNRFKSLGLKLKFSDDGFYIKGSGHRIPEFKISEEFALLLGLLYGDGWMTSRQKALKNSDWKIGLVEDDKGVIDSFSALVRKIFSIQPTSRFRKTYYEVYFNSRFVYEVLNRQFGFPDGYKIGRLKIPKIIRKSDNLLISFLCGVFSTDGKFTLHKGYPRIGVDSATEKFIRQIKVALSRLGFHPRTYVWKRKGGNNLYGLYLNGKSQVKLFYKKIDFVGDKRKLLKSYASRNL